MAYRIDPARCTSCGACELDCPNEAISMDRFTFVIDPEKCKECKGVYDRPHCATRLPGAADLRARTPAGGARACAISDGRDVSPRRLGAASSRTGSRSASGLEDRSDAHASRYKSAIRLRARRLRPPRRNPLEVAGRSAPSLTTTRPSTTTCDDRAVAPDHEVAERPGRKRLGRRAEPLGRERVARRRAGPRRRVAVLGGEALQRRLLRAHVRVPAVGSERHALRRRKRRGVADAVALVGARVVDEPAAGRRRRAGPDRGARCTPCARIEPGGSASSAISRSSGPA